MVSNFLRLAAFVCCGVVLASFLLFAIDQTNAGSKEAQVEIEGTVLHAQAPPPKPVHQPRKFIDKAAKALMTPFQGIVPKDDKWANRLIPTVLALLVFGFGLGFLARAIAARE